jgi:hypothetical protein
MDRRAFLKAAAGASALAGAGGLATPAISQRASARALRFVPQADLANFDPIWSTAYIARNAGVLVWDMLYGIDANLKPQRQMVEAEEVSADGLTWAGGASARDRPHALYEGNLSSKVVASTPVNLRKMKMAVVDHVVDKPVELGGIQAWFVWTLAVTFVVYYFSFQTGYAIVNSSVQKDLGLSLSQVGTVAAVYTWIFALCQFLSGAMLDRLGAAKIVPVSIALVTIGIFVFANAQSYETLLLSQLILAVGACSGFVGAGYVGGQWFGMAKYSFMFGLVQFAASFFSAFNQNLLGLALAMTEWRDLFNLPLQANEWVILDQF